MNKADLGIIKKEKPLDKGILYLSEMLQSTYVVLLEGNNKEIVYSRMFPFTESTKKNQHKIAYDFFKKILQEKDLNNLDL